MARVNNEVPGLKMTVVQDNSVHFRAITTSRNTRWSASSSSDHLRLPRDFRSTLIVSTSIPVSVIGTFALLYFGGFTLNTMTFGGLALGIGMIVDAAIVVLENTAPAPGQGPHDRRHRRQRGMWSAILASTLTHIAVFLPLLFLSGTAASCSRSCRSS